MVSLEIEALESLRKKAEDSTKLIKIRPLEYFLRAMLAGIFIGFALVFVLKSVNPMYLQKAPYMSLVGGFIFGTALVLIIYGGAELFTGNTMYFTTSTMRGYTSAWDTMRVWVLCYVGNAAGAMLFAALLVPTGIVQELGPDNWLFAVAASKMHHTWWEIFFRAIFCNWMVCLAIFVPKQMKNEWAKVFTMMLLVSVFFASGYEHCIANFATFSISLFTSPHPDSISLAGAIHNIIPSTLGNIIGGALFMGGIYTWLNSRGLGNGRTMDAEEETPEEIK